MQNRYDQLAKAILAALLRPVAHIEPAREIPGHVEIADLWVEPDARHADELGRLGVLGRMIERGPCLIEPFSAAPQEREVRGCILEQYSLDHAQARDARREQRPEPPFPGLWVIASGQPERLIEPMELRPMPGWPRGFMRGRMFDPLYLVSVRMLPPTPDTLFLRLLGRGATFRQAVHELIESRTSEGREAGPLGLLKPVMVAFQRSFPQDLLEEEEMDALREFEAIYAEWEREVREEGLIEGQKQGLIEGQKQGLIEGQKQGRIEGQKQGRIEGQKQGRIEGQKQGRIEGQKRGLIEGIEALCEVLDIELTGQRRDQLAAWDTERLERALVELRTSRRWPGS